MKTVKAECSSCSGTGLYAGMAERDGAAVVCFQCKGTGRKDITYTPFTARKRRTGITRVYKKGTSYVIAPKVIDFEGIGKIDLSKEGVTYEEWLSGVNPKHIRQLGCPMMTDQSACHGVDGFTDVCNKLNGGWLSIIPTCKCENKSACWERFDEGSTK